MDLRVPGWEIEEQEQESRDSTGDYVQVIVPSPLLRSMLDKVLGNDRTEGCERERGQEEAAIDGRAGLVRYQLCDHEGESELDGTRKAHQNGSTDHGRYFVRRATHDGSNQTKSLSSNKEVSSSQDVTQSADKEQRDLFTRLRTVMSKSERDESLHLQREYRQW